MKIFDLILQRENEIRQPVTVFLCLPDSLLLQLIVIPDHFIVLLLDRRLQLVYDRLLTPDLFLQLLHVLGPANLLSFEQPDATSRQ